MKAFPRVLAGCLFAWSAALHSLHAQEAGGATLILSDGRLDGSLTFNGSDYNPFSGGAISGASSLTVVSRLSDGSLSTVGTLTKTGTADITLNPFEGTPGAFTLSDGVIFASTGTVNLGSGSTIAFSNPLDGNSLNSGLIFNSGSVLVTNAASTLTTTATINVANNTILAGNGLLTLAPGSVINAGGSVIGGTDALLNGDLLTFGSGGVISAGGTLTLGSGSILTSNAATITDGTLTGGILKVGSGTLTLTGINTYTGTTTIAGGNFGGILFQGGPINTIVANATATLNITSTNIAVAGQIVLSGTTPLNLNIGPDALLLLGRLPLVRDGAPGSTGTSIRFLGGALSNTGTISLLYLPAALDLASDPFSLHFSNSGMHDKFVLQMSFNPATVSSLGDLAKLYLAWFDPSDNSWKNAVDGDSDGGASSHFVLGAYDPSTDFNLGWYGVDTATSTVWAVIDHNSVFGVANSDVAPSDTTADGTSFATFADVPEPSSLGLLLGGLGVLARRRRRK